MLEGLKGRGCVGCVAVVLLGLVGGLGLLFIVVRIFLGLGILLVLFSYLYILLFNSCFVLFVPRNLVFTIFLKICFRKQNTFWVGVLREYKV